MSASSPPHHDAENPPKEIGDREVVFLPRQLNIVWGNDARYWKMPAKEKPNEAAELLQVCWLEVSGSILPVAALGKKYTISFTVSFRPDAFGWNNCPVYVMGKVGRKQKYAWKKIILPTDQDCCKGDINIGDLEITADRVEPIYFGLYEVWSGKWKGGLLLHKATIKPV